MRMKTMLIAGAALLGATGANAAVQVPASFSFLGGTGGLQGGETLYADFNSAASDGGVSGSNYVIQTGSNGIGADPAVGDQGDPYLSVLGEGTANFSFAGLSSLGLDYGSADDYNTFRITYANGDYSELTGTQIITTPPADGNQGSARTNGRLTFSALSGNAITGLTLTSSGNSLEVDNFGVKSAVPEPGTWAMMLIGFGAVGVGMRRSRKAGRTLQAA